ncbi:MAG: sterol desaturase family protein [Acidobacteriota bacterium]
MGSASHERAGDSAKKFWLERSKAGFAAYKQRQAVISRRRLYPVTLFYSLYSVILLGWTLRSSHLLAGLLFFAAGIVNWTLVEYLSHRYILHGHFADGEGRVRRFLHRRLDPLHWEHHARPWDGMHINGTIGDLLPLFLVCAPLSFIAPAHTLPLLLAGTVQGYVVEEWVHHSVHFYHFKNPYFRYIKRHHLYHHSPKGSDLGYGLSSGVWDVVWGTRYPESIRNALYRRPRSSRRRRGVDSADPDVPTEPSPSE